MWELAGREVASQAFGLRTVRVYANGYVRIGNLGAFRAPLERLISIAAGADVGPSGNVYLTVVTDRRTHELHEVASRSGNLRAAMDLDRAGNDVLASFARS